MQVYVVLFYACVFNPVALYLLCSARINRLYKWCAGVAVPTTDFVLLVLAHNEAALLPGPLASTDQLDYPAGRYRTVVVGDNCTDNTAALTQAAGATCLVRIITHASSQAQALRFGAEQLALAAPCTEAVIYILDAACRLGPPFLTGLDQHFARPGVAPVVQCCYCPAPG
jgi:cellulose synthase/poly-beta-1,6-N-acetylglucosamine synthase-like glycosyltransferase